VACLARECNIGESVNLVSHVSDIHVEALELSGEVLDGPILQCGSLDRSSELSNQKSHHNRTVWLTSWRVGGAVDMPLLHKRAASAMRREEAASTSVPFI